MKKKCQVDFVLPEFDTAKENLHFGDSFLMEKNCFRNPNII
jgi:hypothetical protein